VAVVLPTNIMPFKNFSITPYMWSIVSIRDRGMSNMTIGCQLYPQNISAALVMSGQYAWLVAIRYLVMNDLPMFPSGSWYQLSVLPSGLVSRWSSIDFWNGFHFTFSYVDNTCSLAVF